MAPGGAARVAVPEPRDPETASPPEAEAAAAERWQLLHHLNRLLDKPIMLLAFVWLGLMIVDFTRGLSPSLQWVTYAIWAVFALDFALELTVAPHKWRYLRRNWLTALSLLLPAAGILRALRVTRVLRLVRLARSARTLSLVRLLATLNRSLRALRAALGRRGLGYVALFTLAVILAGAAAMQQLESPAALSAAGLNAAALGGLGSYGEALWWTGMLITTIGSDYWPQTAEGRVLAWLLSVYAMAVFGYLAGAVASFFVESDRTRK